MQLRDHRQKLYKYEGWLKVREKEPLQFPHAAIFDDDENDFYVDENEEDCWHCGFVVIRQDEQSLVCYKSEQAALLGTGLSGLLCGVRLDGGYKTFCREWGYLSSPTPPFSHCHSFTNALSMWNGIIYCGSLKEPRTNENSFRQRMLCTGGRPRRRISRRRSTKSGASCFRDRSFDCNHNSIVNFDSGGGGDVYIKIKRNAFSSNNLWTSSSTCSSGGSLFSRPPSYKAAIETGEIIDTSYDVYDSLCTESLDRKGRLKPAASSSRISQNMTIFSDSHSGSHHKFVDFISRHLRSSNLKRTKSVSKLIDRDRKRTALDQHDGSLVQQQSSNRRRNPDLRSSRSHESLPHCCSAGGSYHEIDLSLGSAFLKQVHPSLVGASNCFAITTDRGATKLYQCRSTSERDCWLNSLRRTMHPNQDNIRRTENNLQLWILEAKGIQPKRKYFCELCFDKTLYGRTSAKLKGDICFWGEQFEFNHLPKLDLICANLYREADAKKKKDRSQLIGYVNIEAAGLIARQPVEKWYHVNGCDTRAGKSESPAIRIKARYQTINILPLKCYNELINYLQSDYLSLCLAMEQALSVKAKEDLATHLVHILQNLKLAKEFLCDLVMSEVKSLDNEHLMFRGNSLATKAMEAYMKLVGDQYLQETLGDFVRSAIEAEEDCEVDSVKVSSPSQLEKNRKTLSFCVELAWGKIINSSHYFPRDLREVFCTLRQRMTQFGRGDLADYLISSSIFLRFLCPAILSPSLFNLVSEYPCEQKSRSLTLIAKAIQSLANFTKFGGKELYMEFMNHFIVREWDNMKLFLDKISSPVKTEPFRTAMEFDGYIDLGKELSLIHSSLAVSFPALCANKKSMELLPSAGDLKYIIDSISETLNCPTPPPQCSGSPSSSFPSGSLSPITPISDYDNNDLSAAFNTPSVALNIVNGNISNNNNGERVLRHQGTIDAGLPTDKRPKEGHVTNSGTNGVKPAATLDTTDDYVLYSALEENMSLRKTGMLVQQSRAQHRSLTSPVSSPPAVRSHKLLMQRQSESLLPLRTPVGIVGNTSSALADHSTNARNFANALSKRRGEAELVDAGVGSDEFDADTSSSSDGLTSHPTTSQYSLLGAGHNCSMDSNGQEKSEQHQFNLNRISPETYKMVGSQISVNAISSGYNSLSLSNSSSPVETTNNGTINQKHAGKMSEELYEPSYLPNSCEKTPLSRSQFAADTGSPDEVLCTGGQQSFVYSSPGFHNQSSLHCDNDGPLASSSPGPRVAPITNLQHHPLAFANPLYQLQQTCLVRKCTSNSLPNIECSQHNSSSNSGTKSVCSCCSDPTPSVATIREADDLEHVDILPQDTTMFSAQGTPQHEMTVYSSFEDQQLKLQDLDQSKTSEEEFRSPEHSTVASQSSLICFDTRETFPHEVQTQTHHTPLGPRSLVVLNGVGNSSTIKPRTNPRVTATHAPLAISPSVTLGSHSRSPRMGTVGRPPMRRTHTDSTLNWFHAQLDDSVHYDDESCSARLEMVDQRRQGSLLSELQVVRQQLEQTQARLKEAEQRENLWRQKYEQLRPLIVPLPSTSQRNVATVTGRLRNRRMQSEEDSSSPVLTSDFKRSVRSKSLVVGPSDDALCSVGCSSSHMPPDAAPSLDACWQSNDCRDRRTVAGASSSLQRFRPGNSESAASDGLVESVPAAASLGLFGGLAFSTISFQNSGSRSSNGSFGTCKSLDADGTTVVTLRDQQEISGDDDNNNPNNTANALNLCRLKSSNV